MLGFDPMGTCYSTSGERLCVCECGAQMARGNTRTIIKLYKCELDPVAIQLSSVKCLILIDGPE